MFNQFHEFSGVRICIDPGHGSGSGTGAIIGGVQFYEKDLALTFSLMLRDKLVAAGATVTMSRTDDSNPAMDYRVDIARNNGTDLLISIHMDSSGVLALRALRFTISTNIPMRLPASSGKR